MRLTLGSILEFLQQAAEEQPELREYTIIHSDKGFVIAVDKDGVSSQKWARGAVRNEEDSFRRWRGVLNE